MKKRRILAISDTHCGHLAGLTPPGYRSDTSDSPDSDFVRRRNKFARLQIECWDWYKKSIDSLGKIDILFHLGDCIDGPGRKSGGTELITSDITEQCEMAEKCILAAHADKIIMVYGTPYHVSSENMDAEDIIAKSVNAYKIGSREWVTIYGVTFDLKHKVGKTSIPHGQGTMLAREWLWGQLWACRKLQPESDIYLRGHIHDETKIGRHDWEAISLPGLQWSTKYGTREISGVASIGITVFDIFEDGSYQWFWKIANLESQKAHALKI